MLIDQDRHRLVVGERAQHAADRAAAVDHRVAGRRPDRSSRSCSSGLSSGRASTAIGADRQRVHQRVDLPESEVPGEQQHAAPLRVGGRRTRSSPSNSTRASICSGRHRAELEQLHQQPAEVREHGAGDRRAARRVAHGNAACELLERQPPVGPIEGVERRPSSVPAASTAASAAASRTTWTTAVTPQYSRRCAGHAVSRRASLRRACSSVQPGGTSNGSAARVSGSIAESAANGSEAAAAARNPFRWSRSSRADAPRVGGDRRDVRVCSDDDPRTPSCRRRSIRLGADRRRSAADRRCRRRRATARRDLRGEPRGGISRSICRPADPSRPFDHHVVIVSHDRVRRDQRVERLAQPPAGSVTGRSRCPRPRRSPDRCRDRAGDAETRRRARGRWRRARSASAGRDSDPGTSARDARQLRASISGSSPGASRSARIRRRRARRRRRRSARGRSRG